jgi:nucleotide-binding universal stress UspA family protein
MADPQKRSRILVVPVDFTEVTDAAIQHAVLFSKILQDEIVLLHIVRKEHEINTATQKLGELAEDTLKRYEVKPSIVVRVGKIFRTIREVADEMKCDFAIMGIHPENWKKSLKVIKGANSPFILVQRPPVNQNLSELVVPLGFEEHNRIQIYWIVFLQKYYQCSINIIKPFYANNHRNEHMRHNMYFAKTTLDARNIIFGVRTGKRGGDFADEIYHFVQEINASMIMLMANQYKEYIVRVKDPKNIEVKPYIPIMCVNPATGLKILPGKF